MKTKFVLVDYENVQPSDLGRLKDSPFEIKIFVGSAQGKIPVKLAVALQELGPAAEYIEIEGSGRNALDFHIAYYIGRLSTEHPGATFQIVSNDKGFDPLIKHLKGKAVSCQRVASVSSRAVASKRTAATAPAPIDAVIENLRKRGTAKPRTMKTLLSTIKKTTLGKETSDELALRLFEELKRRGVSEAAGGKITYDASF